MQKTVVITGGAGFLGSHLCEKLLKKGCGVICIDNLITGSQKNIVNFMTNGDFMFIDKDVSSKGVFKEVRHADEIYHFASPADPNVHSEYSYMAHPFETMLVNTVGTWNVCEFAVKTGAKVSFASTSEVYGDPQVSPQGESYRGNVSSIGPRSVYDESKRFGETIVMAFVREKGLDGRITRIFNTYGPKMNPNEGRAIVNFTRQALLDEPITIYGDGSQTRSFCFVDDQIDGQILAMESEKAAREVFNIGNPDEISILNFAEIIKKLTKSSSKIVISEDLPQDDPRKRNPDISKASKILGWKPKVSLEDGLLKTIKYFKSLNEK